jgi:HAMP domain-containing protein
MRLQAKFNLLLCAAFAVGLLPPAAILTQHIAARRALAQAAAESALMMDDIDATLAYNEAQVTPLLSGQTLAVFLPQSVPFYAAAQHARLLARSHPGITYRQPALNPTNPADRPEPWEQDAINRFRADTTLHTLTLERRTPDGPVFSVLHPVRVSNAGCLACHSTPDVAPRAMRDVYGDQNGFGWRLGEVIGAQVVSAPETPIRQRARGDVAAVLGILAATFAVLLLLVNLVLRFAITAPICRLSALADRVSLGEMDAPPFETARRDEIGDLAQAFGRLRRSVVTTLGLLRE